MVSIFTDISAYKYKYDIHVHDKLCSACAHNTPQEICEDYYKAGYSGICLTNHFLQGNTAVNRSLPWEEKMRCYYKSYLEARKFADKIADFDVFFGIEHLYEKPSDGKEVLTYGIDLDFLLANPELHKLPLSEYSRLVHEYGGFISMAHPFRDRGYINKNVGPQFEYLDAVEVYNATNLPKENEKAEAYANTHSLAKTSGGDVHWVNQNEIGKAGIALKTKIHSSKELADVLKSGDYKLIIDGKIIN